MNYTDKQNITFKNGYDKLIEVETDLKYLFPLFSVSCFLMMSEEPHLID